MSKKWLVLVITLIVLLMTMPLLAACDDDDDDDETEVVQPTKTVESTETVTPNETQAQMKEGKLKIGYMAPITGATAESRDKSVDMAVDEVNAAGGVKLGDTIYKFEFEFEDSKITAADTVSAVQKLLYEKNVDFLYSSSRPGPMVIQPYTEEEKLLHFSQWAPEDWIGPEYPYSFMCGSEQAVQDMILLDWISKNRPDIKTVAAIKILSTTYEVIAEIHKKIVPAEYGIEFTKYEFFDHTTRDFYPILTKALQGDPDAIVLEPNMGFMVLKQALELGFKGEVIIPGDMPSLWFQMLSPEELDGIITLSTPKDSPDVLQAYTDYLEAYDQAYNTTPYSYDMTFANRYLSVHIYAAALKAAGSTAPDKLREVMETQTLTLEFPGGEKLDVRFTGQEQFGVNHYVVPAPVYISVIRMDKLELLETVDQNKIYEYRALYDRYRLEN